VGKPACAKTLRWASRLLNEDYSVLSVIRYRLYAKYYSLHPICYKLLGIC
jgi:hypothetical protein